jgi:hypothetical protein
VLTIIVLHRAGDRALRRRSIKLLFAGSAFRVSVSGLVLGLNGGRRAQPGHVVKDRGSPPWLHPRRCAAWGLLAVSAGHDGLDCGNHPMRAGRMRLVRIIGGLAITAVGATCCAIAHKNAAISRAIAAMTTGRFLPAAVSRR